MKIAIIGSGISGLSASYLLNHNYQITLFEKNDYLGGHSRTRKIKLAREEIFVDTGFIVYNQKNYPLLTHLFNHLKVETIKSNMSFGVSINQGWFEYSSNHLPQSLFAQKRNLLRTSYLKMLFDILIFNKKAKLFLANPTDISLAEFLAQIKVSDWFCQYYLLAMGSSIWSLSYETMQNFPAETFIRFFDSHGLLSINQQPKWRTVKGGSRQYVQKISHSFSNKVRLNCNIKTIKRNGHQQGGIEIIHSDNQVEYFDKLVLACHSDEALAILDTPSFEENEILGSIHYQTNQIYLHSDLSLMPKRKKAYASWVYLLEQKENKTHSHHLTSLSYWMNNLQTLKTNQPIIITLNPSQKPNQNKTYESHSFAHPVFNQKAIEAQKKLPAIQGENHTYYCGAWTGYGFHEDGIKSAVDIALKLGAKIPWN